LIIAEPVKNGATQFSVLIPGDLLREQTGSPGLTGQARLTRLIQPLSSTYLPFDKLFPQ